MVEETKSNEEDLRQLLQRNIALSEEIAESLTHVRKYIKWQNVWATVRLLIIIIPLAIGFFYLPPLIKSYLGSYSEFLK
ncbi:MAG: hypothetical protein NT165_03580 [Candidatus Falkowbacteria bacterium]|nr:hypothetical protein [Candidatus Falkowbacteria bacterium]